MILFLIALIFSLMKNLCKSGGSEGADILFGTYASIAKHDVLHYIPEDLNTPAPKDQKVFLTANQLLSAETQYELASKYLKRSKITNDFVKKIVLSYYYQIKDVERVYAVGKWFCGNRGIAESGVGWGVAMAVVSEIKEIYFFDQVTEKWFEYDHETKRWKVRDTTIPSPYGIYAGFGSRHLTNVASEQIKHLYY